LRTSAKDPVIEKKEKGREKRKRPIEGTDVVRSILGFTALWKIPI
jgi:hypothetical protein